MNDSKMFNQAGRQVIIGTIILGAFISSLGQMVMTASLPSIMRDFGITAGTGQWLTTAYLLFLGIMIPLTGYLMDHFSVKKLYLVSILMFLAGCIIAIVSNNFYILLLARIVQSVGAGILLPMPQVVTFRLFEPDKRGMIMGIVGLTTGFGPVVGPTFSGWVVDHFGWHAIFYIMAALSLICIILALLKLKDEAMQASGKLDLLSVFLSTIGFSGILTGVTNQGNFGFGSLLTIIPFFVGLACLIVFTKRQLKIENPLLELRVFTSRDFTLSTILLVFIYGSILTVSTLIPLYIQSVRGLSATTSGLVVFPGALILAFLNPVTGKILDKKGPFLLSLGGLAVLALGTFGIASMDETTSPVFAGGANAVQMLGIVALLQPLMTYAVNAVSSEYVSHATAIMNTIRQIGGAILSAIFVTIMNTVARQSGDLDGIRAAFLVIAIVVVLSIVGVVVFMRPVTAVKVSAPDKARSPESSDIRGLVVTIAREYGSGGHEIGKRVAEALEARLYDSQLISLEAQESGLPFDYIERHEENVTADGRELSAVDLLFVAQSKIIREAAQNGTCVIVGRCADYILRGYANCLNVFIRSDELHKLQRITEDYKIAEEKAQQEARRKDKERSCYYKFYTGQDWGDPKLYHMVLDSGALGLERAARLILDAAGAGGNGGR